jgi:hypothetical protein
MKTKMAFLIVGVLFVGMAGAQSGNGSPAHGFTGTWGGENMNVLPSVDLKIESVGKI